MLTAGLVLALAASAAPAWAAVYVWNNTGSGDWTNKDNWTPTRSSKASTDTMVVDGVITPTPHILKIPSETIRGLLFVNGVKALLETDGSRTLAIKEIGGAFVIAAGCSVTVAGPAGRPIKFSLDHGAQGDIYGTLIFENNAHKLVSKKENPVIFHTGSYMVAGVGCTSNVFDSGGDENTAIFEAGATYLHIDGLNPFGLGAPKTKVIFEEGSWAIFRSAGGVDLQGRTYANLRLENGVVVNQAKNKTFQVDTLVVAEASSVTYLADISPGVIIRGDVEVLDTSTANLQAKTSRTMEFSGGKVQTVRGDPAATVIIGGPTNVPSGTTLRLAHTLTLANSQITVDGTLEFAPAGVLDSPSDVVYGVGGTLRYADSTTVRTVSSTSHEWPASSGPPSVDVRGAGVTMNVSRTVPTLLTVAAPITNAGRLTLPGTTRFEAGGSMNESPTYSGSATLVYAAGHTVGPEWGPGTSVGVGVPSSVTVSADSDTVSMPPAARRVPGNLTMTSGTLALDPAGSLAIGGNWTRTGGTFEANDGTVTFDGAGTQTLSGPGGEQFGTLTLAKSGGALQLLSDLDVLGPGSPALSFDGTGEVLDLNGHNLRLTSGVGGTDSTAALKGSPASGLAVEGAGPVGPLRFLSGAQTLDSLSVNLTGAGLTLGSNLTVGAALDLAASAVVTGADTLTVGPAGVISRTTGYVAGNLRRQVPTGAPSLSFDIASPGGTYAPVTVSFASVTTAGALTASTTDGLHPNAATSGLDPDNTVARVHTLTNEGIGFTNFDLVLNFDPADVPVTAILDSFEIRRFSGGSWTAPTLGTLTPTSAQGLQVPGFGQFIVGERLHHRIYASAGPNGSISPADTVIVRDHSNFTFTFTPDPGYEVSDVLVDSVSVGASTSYTFHSITEDHTIEVLFSIKTYAVTVLVNGLGSVARNINQPSYAYGTLLELTAHAEDGWTFTGWTGDVYTDFNPVQFQVDSAIVVTANFVRVPMDYKRTTFSASYTPISTAGGASTLMTTADDSTRSIPMPFRFVFSGSVYDSTSYLAVNANGFAYPSRAPVTQSLAFYANNANMFSVIPPNSTIAPWYDNLSVGGIGTNPDGSILYQTVVVPGSGRALVVQWTNVSSYATASGGQPRSINFQMVLYEGTNTIEFRYGPRSGSGASILESASIGLEDSLGGNGRYIDAVTGSKFTNNGMMTTNKWPTRNFRFTPGSPTPMAGSYDVGVGRTYTTLSSAISDLNHRGMSGPVTLRLRDAAYDTTAGSGPNVFPILLGPVSGNSAANPITIESTVGPSTIRYPGTPNGNCGNQVLTTAIGNTNEPVFALVGADYVTLRDLSFEGSGEADRGLLLMQSSTTDGAQNNTIENVSARLNRLNTNSIGIQQFVASTPTNSDGTNSGNQYHNLTIRNCYAGVSLAGNALKMDEGCEVGSVGGGQTSIGSTINNEIGGGVVQTFGIRALNQAGIRIFDNDVRGIGATGTGAVDGISIENLGSSGASSGTVEVSGNEVSDLTNTHINAGRVTGIRVNLTANPGSESRIFNNFVHSLHSSSQVTTSRRVVGIMVQEGGGGFGAVHNVDFNSVDIAPDVVDASNTCFEAGTTSGPVLKVRNNVFANFSDGQSGAAKHYTWASPSVGTGPAGSVSDHNVLYVRNLVNGFTGLAGGIDLASLPSWQSATGQDGASFGTNPQFVSPANLHIIPGNPTPVESAGSFYGGSISWVNVDFDHDLRNPSTPDIGADEGQFATPVDADMEAAAFLDPAAGGSVLAGATFTPQVTFENAGLVAQTNVPVRLRFLGPQPATTVVYDDSIVIASVDVGQAVNVTFPSTSLAISGFYLMEATAELAGDTNPSNDQITALLDVAGPLSGTYTVGQAQPAPFNTLTSAIARLNTVGLAGPTTFELEDSLYADTEIFPLNILAFPGASAVNTFTLTAAPGAHPVVQGTTQRAIIVLEGADYVTIDGSNTPGGTTRDLSFVNTDITQTGAVIWGQTTSGDPVTHDTIKNVIVTGGGHDQTVFGIGFGGSTISIASFGSGNNGNRIQNCVVQRAQYGIYSAGASAAAKNTGTVIANNLIGPVEFDRVGRGGILVRFEDGVQITGNRLTHVYTGADATVFGISLGMVTLTSDAITGQEVTNATVAANTIDQVTSLNPTGLSAAGILVAPATSGTTTIVNNMISRVYGPAIDPDFTAGILVGGGGATTRVWFNSVSLDGDRGSGTASSWALVLAGSNPAVDLRNNVLVNRNTGGLAGDPYVIGLDYGTYTSLTSDHNDFFNTGGAPFGVVGGLANQPIGDMATLADWQSATGKDANSVFGTPFFTSAMDLHIAQSGSPTTSAGVAIAGVTTDIDGETRADPPDIGADEYMTYALNLTVAGAGSITRDPDAPLYIAGTPVTVTATADPGYHFVGWSGDITSTVNPITIPIHANMNVTATFAINTYTVSDSASAGGSVVRLPDQPTYDHGTILTLRAVPDFAYHFVGWSGDTTETADSLVIAVTSDRSYVATFAINTYTLTLDPIGHGTAAASPKQPQYDHGTAVQLTAIPEPGHAFIGWGGDTTTTTNPLSVVVTGDRTYSAEFTRAVNVTIAGGGQVDRSPDMVGFAPGDTVRLTAVPDVGYHFVGWSGDTTETAGAVTLEVGATDVNVTATFAINTYPLLASVSGNGSITRDPDQPLYDHGTAVQLTAVPDPGYHFTGWSGDTTETANPITVTLLDTVSVTASFAINTYTVNTSAVGSGSVVRVPDQATYDHGTPLLLRAVPDLGYHFAGWSGDTTETVDSLEVVVTSDRTYTASFEINTYVLDVTLDGSGSVTTDPDQAEYDYGTPVQVTAVPFPGHTFLGWDGDTTGTDSTNPNEDVNPFTVVMNRDRFYIAHFTYTLDVSASGAGQVTRTPDLVAYMPGTVVTIVATPSPGHHFVGWSGDTTSTADTLVVTMTGDRSYAAAFAINTYTLAVTGSGAGDISVVPDQPLYDQGTEVTITATSHAGQAFLGWSQDTTETDSTLTIVMTGDRTYHGQFTYSVTTHVDSGGVILRDPDGVAYMPGTPVQVTAVPDTGYDFTGWSGDTSGTANPITFPGDRNVDVTATFVIRTYPLTVTTDGNGTVQVQPNLPEYPWGTEVQLIPFANPGYHFAAWGGDASGSGNPLTLTVTRADTITASFDLNEYTLTTTAEGQGSVTRDPDQASYVNGSTVTLTAVPTPPYYFVHWEGDALGSTNPVDVTMNGDKNVTAVFASDSFTVQILQTGEGTVDRTPIKTYYVAGDTLLLTASPADGYQFGGWTGDVNAPFNPIAVPIDSNMTWTCNFIVAPPPTINLTIDGNGSVTRNPDLPSYPVRSTVQLTAVPDSGYAFESWTGDVYTSANPVNMWMDKDKNLVAHFRPSTYALDVTAGAGGTVARDPDLPRYARFTDVTVTATADSGASFLYWAGDTSGTTNPITIPVWDDRSIQAVFGYAVATPTVEGGRVEVSPAGFYHRAGDTIQVRAVPRSGYRFESWSPNVVGGKALASLVMDGPQTVTATFVRIDYVLQTIADGHGVITRNPDQPSYAQGTSVIVEAVPDSGYGFVGWVDRGGDSEIRMGTPRSGTCADCIQSPISDNPMTLTMLSDRTLTAKFEINHYPLFLTSDGEGTASVSPDQPLYDFGTSVTLTATPLPGQSFVGWTGDTVSTENPLTIVMAKAFWATAHFTYAVNVSVVGSGTVSRTPDLTGYAPGDTVQLVASPDPGYQFAGWSGDTTATDSSLTLAVHSSVSLTATFALKTYTLAVTPGAGGSVTRDPDEPSYDYGTVVTVTAVPDTGYHFAGWGGDTTETANPITVVVTGDHSYTASFTLDTYTVDVTPTVGGTVLRDPDQATYEHGTTLTLTAVPDTGYSFVGWGGDTTASANPLTLTVTGNHSYTATFAINSYTLDVTTGAHGSVVRDPDQASYTYGTVVTLTAVPDTGYSFIGWSGDTTETANPITFVMTGNRSYGAAFQLASYTLAVEVDGSGSVSRVPDLPGYPYGTEVTLTATPDAGQNFLGWTGDTTSAATSLTITMTGDRSYVASFTVTLDVTVVGGGSVTKTPDQAYYLPYDSVILSAVADPGYSFAGWSGDTTVAMNEFELLMDKSYSLTATFVTGAQSAVQADGLAGVTLTPPLEAWVVGRETELRWTTRGGAASARADLLLSRDGRGGPYVTIASDLPASGTYRWKVEGPESGKAFVVTRVRSSSGVEVADTVAVEIAPDPLAVRAFALGPIAPNPASNGTQVTFALPRDANVRVSVLDIQGREVARLVDGPFTAGRHTVYWNGRTGSGMAPSGQYFVRYRHPGGEVVRRLSITR